MTKVLPTICCILLFSAGVNAQWLSGKVKGESGVAAEKVSVSFLNKNNKITTNEDGSFKIFAPNLPDTLIFSSAGFEPYKVIITEKNIADPNFEVVLLNKRMEKDLAAVRLRGMSSSSVALEEVVVTAGLSTKRKRSLKKGAADRTAYAPTFSTTVSESKALAYSVSSPGIGSKKLFSKDTSIARSGSLTAGEINDFTKWKMWEDLGADEFSRYSQAWNIELKERFSVQLVDKNRNAVKNEKVFLINTRTNDTAWTAITDNTGKAELWGSIVALKPLAGASSSFRISSLHGGKISNPGVFENGVNLVTVDRECINTDLVDIAFVVDATGSMDDEIEFLKLELEDVLQKTSDKYSSLSLRYSSVFYRDNGDEYVTKKIDFQSEMLKVLNFIKLQKSGGGGDFPEAVDQALDVALNNLSWNPAARARILFLLLDAPPHDEAKSRVRLLISRAASMGIRIIPVACSGTDKSTEFLLRSMALGTNGTYTFLTNHSGIGNAHIEPSTDNYSVELLGGLLQRILDQYLYAAECNSPDISKVPVENNIPATKLKIYPNPTSGRFTIESNKDIKEIYVADFSGKLLLKIPVDQKLGKWEVNIAAYPSGIYLLKYVTTAGKLGAEKVVLLH